MGPHPHAPTANQGKERGKQKEDLMVSPRLGPQKSDRELADRGGELWSESQVRADGEEEEVGTGWRGECNRGGRGPLGAPASPDLAGGDGPTIAPPLYSPSRSPPSKSSPLAGRSAINRKVCALRVLLALSFWSPRGQGGDGGAGCIQGGGAWRPKRPWQRWVPQRCGLRTSHLGVGPPSQGKDQPVPFLRQTWKAPPSLVLGGCHRSPEGPVFLL